MKYLVYDLQIGPGDTVVVTLSHQARVLLLDSTNFSAYKCGHSFRYQGGWAKVSPVRLAPPHSGHWHVVVDLGGRAGSVRAGVRIVRCA